MLFLRVFAITWKAWSWIFQMHYNNDILSSDVWVGLLGDRRKFGWNYRENTLECEFEVYCFLFVVVIWDMLLSIPILYTTIYIYLYYEFDDHIFHLCPFCLETYIFILVQWIIVRGLDPIFPKPASLTSISSVLKKIIFRQSIEKKWRFSEGGEWI